MISFPPEPKKFLMNRRESILAPLIHENISSLIIHANQESLKAAHTPGTDQFDYAHRFFPIFRLII